MLPYSIEAEQSVLGAILLDNELISEFADTLQKTDFYLENHQLIFSAILKLRNAADLLTVSEELKDIPNDTSWIEYLTSIMSQVPSIANIKYYIKIVKEKAAERKLINISDKLREMPGGLSETIQEALKDIQALQIEEVNEKGYVPELLGEVVQEIEDNNRKGTITGIPTGFKKLDQLTGGWQPGRYYILGARPKMGKTSLFTALADKASERVPVVIFSLEMTKKELIKLLIYQNSKIDSTLEHAGKLQIKDLEKIGGACLSLYNKSLFIDDRARTIPQIISSLKRAQKVFDKKRKGKIGLIVIDYVQLINGNSKLSRNYQLEEISRSLKEISKDFNVCVLALGQLSRSVEDRKDCRPLPSDMKDSGSFEQDCDGLMLMYRDTYYNGRTAKNTRYYKYHNADIAADITDINFFLNRHGPTDIIKLDFITPFRKFVDPEGGEII